MLEQPPEWDVAHEYTVNGVVCLYETTKDGGEKGIIRIGKTAALEKALKGQVIMDGIIRILIVPKKREAEWLNEWKKVNKPQSS